ncbi:MAG: hypothetical protein WA755_01250 [Candidatus Acidiferrales bacterium]
MKKVLGGLGVTTLLTFSLLAVPAQAQSTTLPARKIVTPRYDVSKEITLKGTVQQVVTKPSKGMLDGAHLLLATPKGTIDVAMGIYAIRYHHVSLIPGEPAEVTGLMTTVNNREVFLVRTVQTSGTTYTLRNARGVSVLPAVHPEKASMSPANRGQGGAR